jgi:hypothetical protein
MKCKLARFVEMQATARSLGRGVLYGDHATQFHGGCSLPRHHDRLKVILYMLSTGVC